MKNITNFLSITALALSGCMIMSFNNYNASITGNTAHAALSVEGNSTFSYKIDGHLYSWSGNDPYANQATIDSKGEVFFTLMSNDPAEKKSAPIWFWCRCGWLDYHNMEKYGSV